MTKAENSRGPEGGASTGNTNLTHNSSTYKKGGHQDSNPEAAIACDSDPVMAPALTPPSATAFYSIKAEDKFSNFVAAHTLKSFLPECCELE
jgi:hypothetical protein